MIQTTTTSVNDEFICPISMQLMRDPVITPNGTSYERSAIEKWIREKGTDPITRNRITLSQLIPNLALRNAILASNTLSIPIPPPPPIAPITTTLPAVIEKQ